MSLLFALTPSQSHHARPTIVPQLPPPEPLVYQHPPLPSAAPVTAPPPATANPAHAAVLEKIKSPADSRCSLRPLEQLPRGSNATGQDCAYVPLKGGARISLLLDLLSGVIGVLNEVLLRHDPTTKWRAMPWHGTLLGGLRSGDIIPWIYDGDVFVPPPLLPMLRNDSSELVEALFKAGIVDFEGSWMHRFCYHERAPRLLGMSPGRWGACSAKAVQGGSYLNDHHSHTYIDGYQGGSSGNRPTLQYWNFGSCVTLEDVLPGNGTSIRIRDRTFPGPSNSEKIITDRYGWGWRDPDTNNEQYHANKAVWDDAKTMCDTWPRRPPPRNETTFFY